MVGAGTMGNGIAQVFAQSGFDVRLCDMVPAAIDRARGSIEKSLGKFVEKGKLTAADRDAALGRLSTGSDLDALADVDYVVEAIAEMVDAKTEVFKRLDAITRPHVILSSNTSSISITVLGAATKRPDKVLGMHFMNPVPLMTLVELIRGQATSPESMTIATELCTTLGKTPVEAADYPGFIANRILMPMINEAIYAVMEGVGTPEAIDTVMKLGMNHPMGPLTLADFIGLDVCLAILNVLHDGLGDPKYRPCPLLRRMVAAGHLGRKSGQGFYKLLMNDRAFVADCYERLLGRPADEAGLAHYAGQLAAGTLTRDALEETLRASDEYLERQKRLSPASSRIPRDVQLCELANPAKWDNPEWLAILKSLASPPIDKAQMHRKAYELTQTIFGCSGSAPRRTTRDAERGRGARGDPLLAREPRGTRRRHRPL